MSGEWRKLRIGDFLTLQYGKALPKSERQSDGKYPVYGANGVKDYSNYYYVQGKTLIIGRKGSVGEITVTEEKFWPLDVTYYAEFDEKEYDINFLYHLLKQQNLESLAKGVKPGINRNLVYDIEVEIPPLDKQKQIVRLLDQAFQAIDQAKANVEKNIQNAEELFQSKLNKIFYENQKNWIENDIGELCEKTSNINWKNQNGKKFDYIDLTSVSRETLSITHASIISSNNAPNRAKKIVKEDDVIFATTRPTLKRVTIVNRHFSDQICSTGFTVLRSKQDVVRPKILFYYIQTDRFMKTMESIQRGTSYPAVTDNDVKSTKIIFPQALSEQDKIILELDETWQKSIRLKESYIKKLELLEQLKNSLLQKAFQGELTQEDAKVTADTYE